MESAIRSPHLLQQLSRAELRPFIEAVIADARSHSLYVAVLILSLKRPDRIDALLGPPSDQVAQHAQQRMLNILRDVDRYVPISDEKVCIVLPGLRNRTQAWLAGNRIQAELEPAFNFDHAKVHIRPTIGIAYYPDHAENIEALLARADIAHSEAQSRDIGIHVFQSNNMEASDSFRELDTALRQAIRENELEVYYQPQISLETGQCRSAEALLRWQHPEYGTVAPHVIIRIAEGCGLIGHMTHAVLNTALRHLNHLSKLGLPLNISVNLSTLSLAEENFPDLIDHTLKTWGIDPALLTLEITEGKTVSDMEATLTVMQRLKKIGVRLSADDFGTGYSSLTYLKRFPLDELKIDRLFIRHMLQEVGDRRIVQSVIDLAHNFDLRCVAEGVEDEATLNELQKMGCDLVQGYVFSKPLSIDKFVPWLQQNNQNHANQPIQRNNAPTQQAS